MKTRNEILIRIDTYNNLLMKVLNEADNWVLKRIRILKEELEWVIDKR